jgi:hypothetical protein
MVEFIIPTGYQPSNQKPHGGTRPYIPVQMMLPSGGWSEPVIFNFDTGASSPTDIPPQLLDDFGYKEVRNGDTRPVYDKKIIIPGFNNPDDGTPIVMTIPCMLQDEDHYDLFRDEPNRKPLLRVRDLMQYVSIVFKLEQTIIRTKDMGEPPEIQTPGTIMFPDAALRSGTPTSSWYWNKWTIINPTNTSKKYTEWFQWNTGDWRMNIKRSTVDKVGIKCTRIDSDNSNANATLEFTESTPQPPVAGVKNVLINARDDDAIIRSGPARNVCGGLSLLKHWSRVIWDNHSAAVPTGQ